MKKSNNINQTAENLQTALSNIDTLARSATAGTLKRIYTASANDNIRKLQASLQRDFSIIDNQLSDTISDAYDLYTLAYSYLHEQLITNGLTDQTPITRTLKNGKEKTRTVYQWACVLVRKEVYANKSIENNGKFTYIEDLRQSENDTAENALDREYIRMGKYDGIQTNADYEQYTDILKSINLTLSQMRIIKMRMQGLSTVAISECLNVSQQAVSKQLVKIQTIATAQYPDMVRYFKGQRNH